MITSLFVKIIGGVYGASIGYFLSRNIYNYFYKNNEKSIHYIYKKPLTYENKIKDAKSFEEILHIQMNEYMEINKPKEYDYDNEHGNTFNIKLQT